MIAVSERFTIEMNRVVAYTELVEATFDLAKHEPRKTSSRKPIDLKTHVVHQKAKEVASTAVAYDGVYLSTCALFEMAIRDLIETFINSLVVKIPSYNKLPKEIKEWNPRGCSEILININQEKFKHLSSDVILKALSTCVRPSKTSPSYTLLVEAFSNNERNFQPVFLEDVFRVRLGLDKVWHKAAYEKTLSEYLGSPHHDTTERVAKERLTSAMQRRNDIIHRGRAYYTPGQSEVKECALFFAALISALAAVLSKHLDTL